MFTYHNHKLHFAEGLTLKHLNIEIKINENMLFYDQIANVKPTQILNQGLAYSEKTMIHPCVIMSLNTWDLNMGLLNDR